MIIIATVIMRVITTDLSENDNTRNDIHDDMKIHSSFLLRFPPLFRLFTPLSRLAFHFLFFPSLTPSPLTLPSPPFPSSLSYSLLPFSYSYSFPLSPPLSFIFHFPLLLFSPHLCPCSFPLLSPHSSEESRKGGVGMAYVWHVGCPCES